MKFIAKLMLLVMVISTMTMSMITFASEPEDPIIKPTIGFGICSEPEDP
jgi:hypothetical protein